MLKPTDPVTEDWQPVSGPVGLAVVGMGNWGPNLLHVLGSNLDAEVRWICDLDRSRLELYQRRHARARMTTRIERVLADPDVDAVVIATPVYTHYRLAAKALDAGKHVFVEQPLVPSGELADELAEVADTSERILMCGQTLVHSPVVRAVRQMIADRKLGEINLVSSSRGNHFAVQERDAGVMLDVVPRYLSLLLYRLSEMPTTVRAVVRDSAVNRRADVALVTLTFASGAVATLELSWPGPRRLRRTVMVGTEGMAVYGDAVSLQIEADEPLRLEMQDFVTAIRSGERVAFETSIARTVARVVEAAETSLARGGREVLFEVDGRPADWRTLAA
jgi:predicted dehydrogenase